MMEMLTRNTTLWKWEHVVHARLRLQLAIAIFEVDVRAQ